MEQDETSNEFIIGNLVNLFDRSFRQCGLNADWSTRAWAIDKGPVNTTEGGSYLLDHEDGTYSVTRRYYKDEGDEFVELIRIDINGMDYENVVIAIGLLYASAMCLKGR